MDKQSIKKYIKRQIKKGNFKVVNASSYNVAATFKALDKSQFYYLERSNSGILAFNTITRQLTIYNIK